MAERRRRSVLRTLTGSPAFFFHLLSFLLSLFSCSSFTFYFLTIGFYVFSLSLFKTTRKNRPDSGRKRDRGVRFLFLASYAHILVVHADPGLDKAQFRRNFVDSLWWTRVSQMQHVFMSAPRFRSTVITDCCRVCYALSTDFYSDSSHENRVRRDSHRARKRANLDQNKFQLTIKNISIRRQ